MDFFLELLKGLLLALVFLLLYGGLSPMRGGNALGNGLAFEAS